MVEKASTRLESVYTRAIEAAKMAVMPPTQATTWKAAGLAVANSMNVRDTMYTHAATMVAAWISALTGVGPSIECGSQTCSGTWEDLPMAPQKIRIIATVSTVLSMCMTPAASWLNWKVPV